MCECNSNFYPGQGSIPYSRVNTQIGLNGLPFKTYTWQSGLTGDEIRQNCQNTYSTPEEIQRCIDANMSEASGGNGGNFWGNVWGGIQQFFAGYGQTPPNTQPYPTPPPPIDEKRFPWATVGVIAGIVLVGGIAWYAVAKSSKP